MTRVFMVALLALALLAAPLAAEAQPAGEAGPGGETPSGLGIWLWLRAIEIEGATLLVVLAVAALVSLPIIWGVPKWQVRGVPEGERFKLENEARKTVAQIVGGVAFLLGLFLTAETLRVNQQGQITDRFTKAIEQLGATHPNGKKKLEVRLGGIYALERIARDSAKRDYERIMEVLTAYVRENAPGKRVANVEQAKEDQEPATDIQAILTVLGRRDPQGERLNLRMVNIPGADLWEATLEKADFRWSNLQRADLTRANLRGARLRQADLRGANLNGADVGVDRQKRPTDLRGADLRGVDLRGVRNLTKAQIDSANIDQHTKLPDKVNQ